MSLVGFSYKYLDNGSFFCCKEPNMEIDEFLDSRCIMPVAVFYKDKVPMFYGMTEGQIRDIKFMLCYSHIINYEGRLTNSNPSL